MAKKKEEKTEEKPESKEKVMIPRFGKLLQKFSVKEQFEMTIFSLLGLVIASIVMAIYLIFFADLSLFMRIMIVINSAFGFIFLISMLATVYQQYMNFVNVAQAMSGIQQMTQGIQELINLPIIENGKVKGGDI